MRNGTLRSVYQQESLQVEHSLEKLNQAETSRSSKVIYPVKYTDFTGKDKEVFLQMFVSHPGTF